MKYLIVKDKKKRIEAKVLELDKLYFKSLFLDLYGYKNINAYNKKFNFLFFLKFKNMIKISNLKKKGSLVLIKNRCNITGRAKSIIRFYKISRIVFREMASFGLLLGIRKSSW